MFVTYSLLAMSTEVPGVRNGPLAQALKLITDPTARAAAGSTAAASSEGGGRGRGRGRGRSGRGGRGGRGSMSRGGSASQLAGADDEEQSGSAAAVDGAVDGEAAEGEEQEEEEATGRRGRKKGKKISWKRAPGSAVERAAGELYAAQVAVGSRWVCCRVTESHNSSSGSRIGWLLFFCCPVLKWASHCSNNIQQLLVCRSTQQVCTASDSVAVPAGCGRLWSGWLRQRMVRCSLCLTSATGPRTCCPLLVTRPSGPIMR